MMNFMGEGDCGGVFVLEKREKLLGWIRILLKALNLFIFNLNYFLRVFSKNTVNYFEKIINIQRPIHYSSDGIQSSLNSRR